MSARFIGDLTNAVRNVTLSRKRALQVIGGVMAVAAPARLPQSAEAGKHHKPPLVFVAVAVTEIYPPSSFEFILHMSVGVAYPSIDFRDFYTIQRTLSSNLTPDKLHAAIAAEVMDYVAGDLQGNSGITVPADRIAVTLL